MTAATLLARVRAEGYTVTLRDGGAGLRIEPRPPQSMADELRAQRDAVLDVLRLEATATEAAGELRACEREDDDLHRLRTGLGIEVDALLWSVLDRLDSARAERCWRHVKRALADDLLSRLVGWVRSLANANAEQVDLLLAGGPRAHGYHDATSRADT